MPQVLEGLTHEVTLGGLELQASCTKANEDQPQVVHGILEGFAMSNNVVNVASADVVGQAS